MQLKVLSSTPDFFFFFFLENQQANYPCFGAQLLFWLVTTWQSVMRVPWPWAGPCRERRCYGDNLQGFGCAPIYWLLICLFGKGGSQSELLRGLHDTETTNARFWGLLCFNPTSCWGFGELLWFAWKKVASAGPCHLLWCLLPLSVRLDMVEIPQSCFFIPWCFLQRGSLGKRIEQGGEEGTSFGGGLRGSKGFGNKETGSPSFNPMWQIILFYLHCFFFLILWVFCADFCMKMFHLLILIAWTLKGKPPSWCKD